METFNLLCPHCREERPYTFAAAHDSMQFPCAACGETLEISDEFFTKVAGEARAQGLEHLKKLHPKEFGES